MTIVTSILKQMPAVRHPQRKFRVVLFTPSLALRGRITGRNLSRDCDYSERTRAGQLRASFDWPEFHQRGMSTARDPRSERIAAQDASCIPKSGKPTCGLGHFFNGCANRAERGLEIATLAVVEVSRRWAVTLAVAQPPPGKADARKEPRAEETRRDFSAQQLPDQHYRFPRAMRYQCVDGDFAKQKYRDAVTALKLHVITTLRPDANWWLLYSGPPPTRRGRRRKYEGQVNFQDGSRFESLGTLAEHAHLHLYPAWVWHGSLNRRVRIVGLINRKAVTTPRYLIRASTDVALDGRKRVEYYVARFQIAFLFRDSTQFTGLADCQSRAATVLAFHFHAALATLNLARAAELRTQPELSPRLFSMASGKQRHFNERLLNVFIANLALDPLWVKNHPGYENLRTYGAIAA